ncbi:MAG: hypothetical protein QXK88_09060 [Desulfurococcaceae archaeon]
MRKKLPARIFLVVLIITASIPASLVSLITKTHFMVLSPAHSVLILYISGLTLFFLVNDMIFVNTRNNKFFLQRIQIGLPPKYIRLFSLVMFILLILYLEIPLDIKEIKAIIACTLLIFILIILRSINATFESIFSYLLIALSIPLYIWFRYPYYIGNDTNRDLYYAFNTLLTGHYRGSTVYPINTATYIYSILLLIANPRVFSIVVSTLEIAFIISITGIYVRIVKNLANHNGNHVASLLMLLAQPLFVIWLASWFINQTLALLLALIIFYMLIVNKKNMVNLKSNTIALCLLGVILSITHPSLSLYITAFFLIVLLYVHRNVRAASYSKFLYQITLIILFTTMLYVTSTTIINWTTEVQGILLTFIKNFINVLFGDQEYILTIPARLEDPYKMMWFYLPFANLLVLSIIEFTMKNNSDMYNKLMDIMFLYTVSWIAIGVITSTDPVMSLTRYFIVPSIAFLPIYFRRVIFTKRTALVRLLVALSVIAMLTNGSIISSLDLIGSGRGYPFYPPSTSETEFLSRMITTFSQPHITIVTDLRLAPGITQASLNLIHGVIVGHPMGIYLPIVYDEYIDLRSLGIYGWVLDSNVLSEIRVRNWILLLRPEALEYMQISMIEKSYSDIIRNSDILLLHSKNVIGVIP